MAAEKRQIKQRDEKDEPKPVALEERKRLARGAAFPGAECVQGSIHADDGAQKGRRDEYACADDPKISRDGGGHSEGKGEA